MQSLHQTTIGPQSLQARPARIDQMQQSSAGASR